MEAKRPLTRTRRSTTTGTAARPASSSLDAMAARHTDEVLGVLGGAGARREGRVPIGLWKTGWLAQPEGAA